MGENLQLALPSAEFLEEVNLSRELAHSMAEKAGSVEILLEEPPATRRVKPDDTPLLIDADGNYWSDFRPVRGDAI